MEFEGWTTIDNNTLSERIDETNTELIQYQDYGNMGCQVSKKGIKNRILFFGQKSIYSKKIMFSNLSWLFLNPKIIRREKPSGTRKKALNKLFQ